MMGQSERREGAKIATYEGCGFRCGRRETVLLLQWHSHAVVVVLYHGQTGGIRSRQEGEPSADLDAGWYV